MIDAITRAAERFSLSTISKITQASLAIAPVLISFNTSQPDSPALIRLVGFLLIVFLSPSPAWAQRPLVIPPCRSFPTLTRATKFRSLSTVILTHMSFSLLFCHFCYPHLVHVCCRRLFSFKPSFAVASFAFIRCLFLFVRGSTSRPSTSVFKYHTSSVTRRPSVSGIRQHPCPISAGSGSRVSTLRVDADQA